MQNLGKVIEQADGGLVNAILDVFARHFSDDIALDKYAELAAWRFEFNSRANGRYGQCNATRRVIQLHSRLVDHPADYWQTLAHEIAHAIEFILHGDSSHGARWQRLMRDLGANPDKRTAHTAEAADALQSEKMKTAKEVWICTKCETKAPINRRRKYAASAYRHNKCGGAFAVFESRR